MNLFDIRLPRAWFFLPGDTIRIRSKDGTTITYVLLPEWSKDVT